MTRRLPLSLEQQVELVQLRDHAPQAYLWERAWALLWMGSGRSAARVARYHCQRQRRPETVGNWLTRYLAEGVAGLYLRPGRGRKPAFSPCVPDGAAGARRDLEHRAPRPGAVGATADALDVAQPAGGL